jgi:hypothetical protein
VIVEEKASISFLGNPPALLGGVKSWWFRKNNKTFEIANVM